MTKKRLYGLVAVLVVMTLAVFSLVACNNNESKLEDKKENNTQVEQPIIDDNAGGKITNDYSVMPTSGMEYELSSDGKSFILKTPGAAKEDSSIVVPSTHIDTELGELPVTEIADNAFKGNGNIADLTILGANLKVIGVGAFRNCEKLTTVVLPESLTTIRESAFRNCKALNQLSIPKEESTDTSKRAPKTVEIPLNVDSLGDYAFLDCEKIDNVVVPEGVTSIGKQVFMNCTGIKNIKVSSKLLSIGEEAFRGCSSITQFSAIGVADDVAKDHLLIPSTVTEIGASAFMDNSKIKKVVLPKNVSVIAENLFRGCSKIVDITIENKNITVISDYAFSGCNALQTINKVGDTVAANLSDFPLTRIGKYAFSATYALKEINLPRNLTIIDDYAFRKCGIEKIDLLGGLNRIGKFAFEECDSLVKVGLPATLKVIDEGAFRLAGKPITETSPDNPEEEIPTGEIEIGFDFTGTVEQWNSIVKLGPYVWGNALSEIKIACHNGQNVEMVDLVLTNPVVDKDETPEVPDNGDNETDTGTDSGTDTDNTGNNETETDPSQPEEGSENDKN